MDRRRFLQAIFATPVIAAPLLVPSAASALPNGYRLRTCACGERVPFKTLRQSDFCGPPETSPEYFQMVRHMFCDYRVQKVKVGDADGECDVYSMPFSGTIAWDHNGSRTYWSTWHGHSP